MKNKRSLIMASGALKKPFLIMRLTIFFTIFSVFHSFAGVEGQTVSLDMNDTEIRKVLAKFEIQGTYRFLFNSRLEEIKQRVDASFTNTDITVILSHLFSGTGLSFKQLDNNLIAIRLAAYDENDVSVSGRVTGPSGDPLAGVSVSIKGRSTGTTTNVNGEYALSVP
ncbi:MAG: SusC/RagA family TonB-linked outer membrane protein, partial [Chitinophagaceae bacterium]|nr:SusC/RagA family TonB-linked outer membrane protein [Chitinophagaceae bacterium]